MRYDSIRTNLAQIRQTYATNPGEAMELVERKLTSW